LTTLVVTAWWLSDTHLYLGTDQSGNVALYAGTPANFYGVPLHVTRKTYGISAQSLPADVQRDLSHGLQVSGQAAADDYLRTQTHH
jgi:hypothetical protein